MTVRDFNMTLITIFFPDSMPKICNLISFDIMSHFNVNVLMQSPDNASVSCLFKDTGKLWDQALAVL